MNVDWRSLAVTGHGGLVRLMTMSKTMIRLVTFSGMIAALAAISVLFATLSQTGRVQAAEDKGACQIVQIAVDEGYGVSGTVAQRICE